MTDTFSRNVMISLTGHVVLAALIFFRAVTAPNERMDIRNAIRVDVVDLPKKMEALPDAPAPKPQPVAVAQPPPPPAPKAVAKPKAPEVPTPKKKPDAQKAEKRALDKIKEMAALDKIKQDVSRENAPKPKPTAVAGNQVNAGNALTGLEKIEFDRYFQDLENKIHGQWNIPQWLADQDLKAQVLVLIDERGYVVKKVFRKSSGNEIFDAKVVEAIDTSSPLPPPPQRLRGLLSTSGIVFNFPQ